MDCSEWLSSLPNFCLHFDEKNTSSNAPDHRFYDIDCCLRSFKNINGILSRSPVGQKPSRTSPTSVAAEPESPPPRTSFQPIPRSSGKRKFNNVAQDGTCPGDDRKLLKPSFEAPAPLAPRNLQSMSQFQGPILCNAVIPTAKRGDNYFVENNDITLRAVEPRTEIVILSEPPSQPGKWWKLISEQTPNSSRQNSAFFILSWRHPHPFPSSRALSLTYPQCMECQYVVHQSHWSTRLQGLSVPWPSSCNTTPTHRHSTGLQAIHIRSIQYITHFIHT